MSKPDPLAASPWKFPHGMTVMALRRLLEFWPDYVQTDDGPRPAEVCLSTGENESAVAVEAVTFDLHFEPCRTGDLLLRVDDGIWNTAKADFRGTAAEMNALVESVPVKPDSPIKS